MRRLITLLTLCQFLIFCSQAQTPKVDSLLKILPSSKNDTPKALTFIELSSFLQFSKPNLALSLVDSAIRIANNLGWKRGLSTAYKCKGNIFRDIYALDSAYYQFNQSLIVARSIHDRMLEANAIASLGNISLDREDIFQAHDFYHQANSIFKQLVNVNGVVKTSVNIAYIYYKVSDYKSAIKLYKEAFKLAIDIGDKREAINILNTIGECYE